jgi:hypothetical protein
MINHYDFGPFMKLFQILVLIIATISLQGCISFQGDPLPRNETVGDIEALAGDYEFVYRFRHYHGDDHEHSDIEADTLDFVVEKTLKRIGAIDSYSGNKGILQIKVVQEEDFNSVFGFISGITLFIIPCYGEDHLTLTATYTEAGKVIHKTSVSSSVSTLYEFFLLFAMPFTDGYEIEKNTRYLTEEACYQLMKKMGLETLRKE